MVIPIIKTVTGTCEKFDCHVNLVPKIGHFVVWHGLTWKHNIIIAKFSTNVRAADTILLITLC